MSCCGQRRGQLRRPAPERADATLVAVKYGGADRVEVDGRTGRTYVFTPDRPIQSMEPVDARALLRSSAFRLL